jgi:3'-phosphoadenosine 5'-phosphosulfate sulfotransferase (PAPS reductase)/FAD synthetase
MTPELAERLAGRSVVASVSGGKDSAALSLWLTEQGIEHDRVFADTGWEHASTYDYLRGPLARALGPIDEVRSPGGGMADWCRKKGMFPSRLRRFCTSELKVRPIIEYLRRRQDEVGEVVNAVGIRAAESKARAGMPEWEWQDDYDCEVWRPLLRWTEQDVIDIHTRHGLRPNPLYLAGAARVGCWPCIFARKAEIKLVADLTPERIDEIRALESEVSAAARARAERDGTHATFIHGFERTFFHGKLSREGKPFPIDTIVEWSRTAPGGRQYVLVEDEQPEGCARWGLCDVADAR